MQSAPTPHIHEAIKVAGSKRGEVNRAYLFLLHEFALPGGVLWTIFQDVGVSKRGAKLEERGISDASGSVLV